MSSSNKKKTITTPNKSHSHVAKTHQPSTPQIANTKTKTNTNTTPRPSQVTSIPNTFTTPKSKKSTSSSSDIITPQAKTASTSQSNAITPTRKPIPVITDKLSSSSVAAATTTTPSRIASSTPSTPTSIVNKTRSMIPTTPVTKPTPKARGVIYVDATNPIASSMKSTPLRVKKGGNPFEDDDVVKVETKTEDNKSFEFETMAELARQVENLGGSTLTRRAKREWEAKKIVEMGGHAPKSPKMPLNALKGIRKANKERQQRSINNRRAKGLPTPKKRKERSYSTGPKLTEASVGKMKSGILTISPREIRRVSSTSSSPNKRRKT